MPKANVRGYQTSAGSIIIFVLHADIRTASCCSIDVLAVDKIAPIGSFSRFHNELVNQLSKPNLMLRVGLSRVLESLNWHNLYLMSICWSYHTNSLVLRIS